MNKIAAAFLAGSLTLAGCEDKETSNQKELCFGSEKVLPDIARKIYSTIPTVFSCKPKNSPWGIDDLGFTESVQKTSIFLCQMSTKRDLLQCAIDDTDTVTCKFSPVINNRPFLELTGTWRVSSTHLDFISAENIFSISIEGSRCNINGVICHDPKNNCRKELTTDKQTIDEFYRNLLLRTTQTEAFPEGATIVSPILYPY